MSLAATEEQLRALMSRAVFGQHFRLAAVGEGRLATLHASLQPALERPGGVVGGPAFMAAADVAMWLAVLTRLGPDDASVTADLKTTFLGAARQEDFFCTARILKLGRRSDLRRGRVPHGRGRL